MGGRRYTEHDHEHYERPRRRTRPRTKARPAHEDAVEAVVVTVDRGRFTLLLDGRTVTAMKSRNLGRKGAVVGDRVRVVGDVSGDEGSLARIVEVTERATTLRRTADDDVRGGHRAVRPFRDVADEHVIAEVVRVGRGCLKV